MAMRAGNAAALVVSIASIVKNAPIAASSVIVRAATLVTVSLLATVRVLIALIALIARIAATALTALNGRDFGDRPRRDFGDRPRFDNKKPFRNRFDGPRQDFGTRSGPRARAYDTRRFAERSEFARNAMVKIDSDIADFFGSPEAVNQALRLLIDVARTVKFPQAAAETPNAELEPATAAQIFGETDIDDDDVEDSEYGDGAADSAMMPTWKAAMKCLWKRTKPTSKFCRLDFG